MEEVEEEPAKKKKSAGRILLRILIVILVLLLLIAIAGVIFMKVYVKPPEVNNVIRPSSNASQSETGEEGETQAEEVITGRDPDKYTFVVFGMDNGNGNTDTIMVATYDAGDGSLNIVSVPRDTMVNVPWQTKKVNSIYANTGGAEGFVKGLSDLLGYEVDFYVKIDLDAFVTLIDAIGGVYYDVPVNMNYEDPTQKLYIHINKGYQLLNGEDAMKVIRFRRYGNGDIGRINTQQDFLKTAAQQILENKKSINVSTYVNVFLNDVETDLTYGNLVWFGEQFLKMNKENINFYTLPGNYGDHVRHGGKDISYVTVYVDEWLDMVNQYLNPFVEPIELENVNILTRNPNTGKLYATSGELAFSDGWGGARAS
ncbi:MAG: LCP family protein [Oscillospiraceae bacterium]|nr:LCP family protein [Oscillospiraceae bacterium]